MTSSKHWGICAVACVLAAGAAAEVYRLFDRRAIAREADQARDLASASASPATVPDDARRWLESNGYRVVVWNPHHPRGFVGMQESSHDGKYAIVQGQRQIREGNWLVKRSWLDLTFRFTLDGRFHDVQANESPLEAPSTRPAAQFDPDVPLDLFR